MRTVSEAWTTAARRTATIGRADGAYQPIVLVELVGINRFFATRHLAPDGPRTFGDGGRFGAGLAFGDQQSAYELDLAEGGIGAVGVELAEQDNLARVSGTVVQLLNYPALLGSLGLLDNTAVRLRLGFTGLALADYLTIWSGVVDRAQDRLETIDLELVDGSFQRHRNLSTAIDPQYFPGAPAASRNLAIPILLGVNTDAPTIQVSGAASGSLAFAISSGSTDLFLREYGAPFPATGTLTIAAETGVTYAARTLVTLQGITYLRLSGLVRGAPTTHAAGEAVTLTNVQYRYLIGYQISDLDRVRDDGVILAPAAYTLSVLQADRPVSILTFTSQRGTITVDVNAANVDMNNLLSNGGWETGTNSGWTPSAGATIGIASSTPSPIEGAYYLELTGGAETYEENFQEWPTIPGEDYRLELSWQNTDSDLLPNGGFETGDLTGWSLDPNGLGQVAVVRAGDFVGFSGTFSLLQQAADGQYFLRMGPAGGVNSITYSLALVADLATAIGQQYVLTFRHLTQFYTSTAGILLQWHTQVGVQVGTPTAPQSLIAMTFEPWGLVLQGAQSSGTFDWANSQPYVFTASATTTRITLVGRGFSTNGTAPALFLDAVRVQLGGVLDTSQAAYQLGTPTDPEAYSALVLPLAYSWQRHAATFRATSAAARLTLRSQYTVSGLPRASYFDDVRVQRVYTLHAGSGGENPVEQMRYLVDTFLPHARYAPANFSAAYRQLLDWKFSAVLTNPGDSRALLQRMARQCGCLLYENADGMYQLVVLHGQRAVVFGFDQTNMVEDSFEVLNEPLDNIATAVYVYFGARTGGAASPADFQGVTYATPTDTTHPDGPRLTTYCQGALRLYKRERKIELFADCIADFYTANLLLRHEVQTRTIRRQFVSFSTWLDAAPLELGDVVQVRDPRYADSAPVLCEVTRVACDVNAPLVQITARTLGPAGWSATFEYEVVLFETGGWGATFDYTPSKTEGAGWSAAFETDTVPGQQVIVPQRDAPWQDEQRRLRRIP